MSQLRTLVVSYKWLSLFAGMIILLGMGAPATAWSQQMSEQAVAPNPVGTVFTYQGRLSTNSGPATGAYDFQFTLYDAETDGTVIGGAQAFSNISVTAGVFMVPLDFGADAFPGAPRWLEIAVRPAGNGEFEALAPRQPLTPVPYAIFAENVNLNVAQARVAGTCPDGSSIRVINGDGTVTCEADDVGGGNNHDHLGQTWIANGTSLTIEGSLNGLNNAPLILNNTGTGSGLIVKSQNLKGILVQNNAGNGIDVENNSEFATIYAANKGTGNGIGVVVTDANAFNAENNSQFATLYAENISTASGVYGIAAVVKDGNALNLEANSTFAAAYVENFGSGHAVSGVSRGGVGGYFATDTGDNIIVAYDIISNSSQDLRFRVSRTGNVNADGTISGGGADFAEMLPAQTGLEPGDVLVVGITGELVRSTTANATNVAGIYSTKPGFLGGVDSLEGVATASRGEASTGGNTAAKKSQSTNQAFKDIETTPSPTPVIEKATEYVDITSTTEVATNQVPLAVIGVVPVKVTAENGPIQPGDLLTTSSTPGHAMKASPVNLSGIELYRPGTILGKALEPWSDGAGVIQILLVLQ